MALFKKKKEAIKKPSPVQEVPKLPELPKMGDLPALPSGPSSQPRPATRLPSYPSNSLAEKFSQNTIKQAVTGHKEDDMGYDEDDFEDFDDEDPQMIHEPMTRGFSKQYSKPSDEPVFIRIDKFEDSLKTFENAQKQIQEIESMLKDIRNLQDEEEKELSYWEKELINIKNQIEKIDREVFSRIE